MGRSRRTRETLVVLATTLLLGAAFALIDGTGADATLAVEPVDPATRDAYGVAVLPREADVIPWEGSTALRSARLRDDIRRAIVIR
jgi:hypothetical protein